MRNGGAETGIRTRTGLAPQRFLRPQRLPFRHFRSACRPMDGVIGANDTRCRRWMVHRKTGLFRDPFGAEDEIRTRDLLLGKEMLYH